MELASVVYANHYPIEHGNASDYWEILALGELKWGAVGLVYFGFFVGSFGHILVYKQITGRSIIMANLSPGRFASLRNSL